MVLVACISPLLGRGVLDVLRTDRRLRVIGSELGDDELKYDLATHASPRVAVLGELVTSASLEYLQSREPAPGVLVIAHDLEPLVGPLLLTMGVSSLARTASTEDFLAAVHMAANARAAFVRTEADQPKRGYPTDVSDLTDRELEVLECLSKGFTNQEIADALQISAGTVRTHVARIFRKLGRNNRRELIGMQVPRPKSKGE